MITVTTEDYAMGIFFYNNENSSETMAGWTMLQVIRRRDLYSKSERFMWLGIL